MIGLIFQEGSRRSRKGINVKFVSRVKSNQSQVLSTLFILSAGGWEEVVTYSDCCWSDVWVSSDPSCSGRVWRWLASIMTSQVSRGERWFFSCPAVWGLIPICFTHYPQGHHGFTIHNMPRNYTCVGCVQGSALEESWRNLIRLPTLNTVLPRKWQHP